MSKVIQFRRSTAILTLIAASIGGGLVAALAVATRTNSPAYVTARADTNTQRVSQLSNSFADIIEKASPAVVNISSTRIVKASEQDGQSNPFMSDPFFRQFFGNRGSARPRAERESGVGSGVIISPDGYILTNNHVVEKATTVRVTLMDKREFSAKVIGADPQTDVAVVKISAGNGLPILPLGNSDGARVGDLCFAIGNPFNYDHTVTMGIVSAKGRSLEGMTHIQDFIQTDAAINPGNSGGALINANGQLIGINTAILTGGNSFGGEAGNIGIGFAVPVNLARTVMDQIIKTGKVSRGYMGVTLQGVTPELAQQFGLKEAHGAIVNGITPGSPGAKAGLQQGDVITAIDGVPVEGSNDLTLDVTSKTPGTTVKLNVIRNGQPTTVNVTLGQRPTGLEWDKQSAGQDNGNGPSDEESNGANATVRGLTVETLTPELAEQAGVPAGTKGVVVDDVDQASAAGGVIGLGRGAVITAVDRKPVANVRDFQRAIDAAQGKAVLLTVSAGGQTAFTVLPAK